VEKELSLVARRIQEVRTAKKLSRQQLADKLGITYLQVYRIETGVTEVSADVAAAYADALDVSVASLFRESRAAS
jgi:transcriptional regulator with XRE-family HTH domain